MLDDWNCTQSEAHKTGWQADTQTRSGRQESRYGQIACSQVCQLVDCNMHDSVPLAILAHVNCAKWVSANSPLHSYLMATWMKPQAVLGKHCSQACKMGKEKKHCTSGP